MRPLALLTATALLLASVPALAEGKKDAAHSSLAVLEFRAGARGAANLGMRLSAILRKDTSHAIVDPDDARRTAGPKIDETVARCSGEPRCIADIGKNLQVDEILLVGVSELGDIIVAIQRVDTRTGTVVGRVADSLPGDLEPSDDVLEGYLRRLLPPGDFNRFGSIRVDANVTGALVEVDGQRHGTTPIEPISIPAPSTVDLRVSKSGYTDFKARIDVLPDASVAVRTTLTRKATTAWYQRWWVWAIAGTVVAGGVATAVILSQPEPSSVPVTVHF